MKVFITGINGFIGSWLARFLLKQKCTVIGLARKESQKENAKINCYYGDILDFQLIKRIIQQEKPTHIFHLAAQSNIPHSFSHPQETVNVNVNGTLNVLESIRQTGIRTTFLSVGSSAEYGPSKQNDHPLSEDASLRPRSPYAVSKASQGYLTRIYKRAFGLDTIHIRPFAVIGPGKKNDALADFARGIVEIERGEKTYLTVGTIDTIRDFIDVRDAVEALLQLAKNKSHYDTYNLCRGKGIKLREILNMITQLAHSKITIKQTLQKKRQIDDAVLVGSPKRILSLGFRPCFPIEVTVKDTLNYWRNHQ